MASPSGQVLLARHPHRLELRAADLDEGKLGRDEECVRHDQQRDRPRPGRGSATKSKQTTSSHVSGNKLDSQPKRAGGIVNTLKLTSSSHPPSSVRGPHGNDLRERRLGAGEGRLAPALRFLFPRGVSVENHEFRTAGVLDWGRSFHEDSVEVCLNLRGNGTVRDGRGAARYQPHTVGFYCNSRDLQARRDPRENHSFITIELSRPFVSTQVHTLEDALHPAMRRWLGTQGGSAPEVGAMSPGQELTFQALRQPPVPSAAHKLWYQAKTLEVLSTVLFQQAAAGGIFLPAPETRGARAGGTHHRHPAHPPGRAARHRVARRAGRLQPLLSQPPFLEGDGHDHPAVPPPGARGARGRPAPRPAATT